MFDFSSQVLQSPTTGWRLWHSNVHKSLENLKVEVAALNREREEIDVDQWRLVFAKDAQEYDFLRTSGHNLREVRDRELRALIVHVADVSAVLELQKMLRAFVTEPEPEQEVLWRGFTQFIYGPATPFWSTGPRVQNVQKLIGTRISALGRQLVYGYGSLHTWTLIEDKFHDLEWRLISRMHLDFCNQSRAKSWEHWASEYAQPPLESSQGINGEEKTWRPRRITRPPATPHSASGSRTARRRCWSRGRRRPSISGS